MNNLSLSIVSAIACHSNVTETFLLSLSSIPLPKETQFVFCLDGHVDLKNEILLEEFIKDKSPSSKVLKNDYPVGYSKTVNRILKNVKREHTLLIDSDVMLSESCLSKMIKAIANPDISSVQPVLIYPQTMCIQSYGHIFGPNFNNHAYNGKKLSEIAPLPTRAAQGLTTACQIFKTDLFHTLGGLDESYYNAYEGLELSLKFREQGYKTLVIGDAIAYHFQGRTRQNITLNESIANSIFWSKWSDFLENDFSDFYNKNEWPTLKNSIAVNASNLQCWNDILNNGGQTTEIKFALRSRGTNIKCWEDIPLEFMKYPGVVVFLCDHFSQVNNNDYWFLQRKPQKTLILDLHGNQIIH